VTAGAWWNDGVACCTTPSFTLITACTVVQAVVKATSQSNGKGQILTPRGSETPERISMKLRIYNRVAGMTTHANPCGAATTWVVDRYIGLYSSLCGARTLYFARESGSRSHGVLLHAKFRLDYRTLLYITGTVHNHAHMSYFGIIGGLLDV